MASGSHPGLEVQTRTAPLTNCTASRGSSPWKDAVPLMSSILQLMPKMLTSIENVTAAPSGQWNTFTAALKKVLHVSHTEMQHRQAQDKKARAAKPRPSSRVSRDKR